jgi:mRNA interferase RelE/StbE
LGRGAGVAEAYEVRLLPAAAREYRTLRGSIKGRIGSAVEALAVDPRPPGASKLAGRDGHRVRVGDYRIVFAVDDARAEVIVARIAHRREVYRR